MLTPIILNPVGVVRANVSDEKIKSDHHELESVIDVLPEFGEALDGIEGFSHIVVIAYLHKPRSHEIGVLKVKPRRLLKRGFKLEELPLLGVFALDAPVRPNPIGITVVKLLRRDGLKLLVRGLDYFDGTPVLDLKPYQPDYRVDDITLPEWYTKLADESGHV